MQAQDPRLGAGPGLEADSGSSPPQDFLLQQDNLLDHLVPAEAREDEVETSEQHREAGTTEPKRVTCSSLWHNAKPEQSALAPLAYVFKHAD